MTIYDEVTAEIDTQRVLNDVAEERHRQRQRYGLNRDLELGTGPGVRWLSDAGFAADMATAEKLELLLRRGYEAYEAHHGKVTWMHLIREEVAEAFAESDPDRLRAELLQVAALCVSAVETLDARRSAQEDSGPICCTDGCCGPGSYCCAHANPHTHEED